jgi:hypothetical protein
MTGKARHSLSRWKVRHSIVVVIGVLLNLCYAVSLLLAPTGTLGFLGIPPELTPLWPRLAGCIVVVLSVFYLPSTIDLDRYRILAWLEVFPARTSLTLFLFVAVLGFGYPGGLLVPAVIEGGVAIAALYCLIRVSQIEQDIANGWVTA